MSSADTTTDAPEEPPRDEVREELLARLTEALGDAVLGSHVEKGDIWVRVRNDSWRAAVEFCRDRLDCDYFCFLSGIDWMPATAPNPEAEMEAEEGEDGEEGEEQPAQVSAAPSEQETGIVTGVAGGDTRFQVFARLYSTTKHHGITLKADLDDENPSVETITSLYRGASWHEREAIEMLGFDFTGSADKRNLYLPGDFEGYPLRKDFPLLAREVKPWPGIVDVEPMPDTGEGDEAAEEG